MKILSNIKKSTRRVIMAGIVTASVLGLGAFKMAGADTVSFSSARDCDANAVIAGGALSTGGLENRYDNGNTCTANGQNYTTTHKDIADVYGSASFGISASDVHAMANEPAGTHVVAGTVTTGDVVVVDGKVVATNVITAGRGDIAGSTRHTNNGTVFYTRAPHVSFASSSLDAFVVMKDGVFQFAIIASCGNPVHGTPKTTPKTPDYTIQKEVKQKGDSDSSFASSINNVQPGTHVIYRITVKSTGDAAVDDLKVWDNLPSHVQLVKNTLTRDGNNVTQANEQDFFASGISIAKLASGDRAVFRFEAIVGPNDTATKCVNDTFDNEGVMNATQLPKKSDHAKVTEVCKPPKPEFACTILTAFPNSRAKYTFTAKASADNGAVITKYVFNYGDNSAAQTVTTSNKTTTVAHTYANLATDKTYTATVTVFANVGGKSTSDVCKVPVTVKATPAAECTDLVFTQNNENKRIVTVHAVVATKNGAKLNSVTYDFGDSSQTEMRNDLNTVDHTYASTVDEATIKATVTFTTASNVPQSVCQAQVSFTSTPPSETPPSELANTGPGSVAGMFAAVTVLGAFAHRIFLARRLDS